MHHEDDLDAKGIDRIVVVSVDEPFVMSEWARTEGANGTFTMMANPDAQFTRAMDLDTDVGAFGLGVRSSRYAAMSGDGVATSLDVEKEFLDHEVRSAEAVLTRL